MHWKVDDLLIFYVKSTGLACEQDKVKVFESESESEFEPEFEPEFESLSLGKFLFLFPYLFASSLYQICCLIVKLYFD